MTPDKTFHLLTHLSPFQIWPEKSQNAKFELNISFPIESTTEKNCNTPLDALMCPLQNINNIEFLSLTIDGVNQTPNKCQKLLYQSQSETGQPKKNTCPRGYIFTPFYKSLV